MKFCETKRSFFFQSIVLMYCGTSSNDLQLKLAHTVDDPVKKQKLPSMVVFIFFNFQNTTPQGSNLQMWKFL